LYKREDIQPVIEGKYRKGDIRHCYASTEKARDLLGFAPNVTFEDGMRELIEWAHTAESSDRFDAAARELKDKGLA
jgi:dTDP-L-rhamnose 4-epimerase